MNVEVRNINELKAYANNPRKNEKGIPEVAKSIKEFGFRNPVLIDENDEIIAGHTRIEAAKTLGITEVPTIKITDLTEEQVKAFRIADNRTGEFSQWDFEKLQGEFETLGEMDFELDSTGFTEKDRGIISLDPEEEKEESESEIEKVDRLGKHQIECPKCHHKFERGDK